MDLGSDSVRRRALGEGGLRLVKEFDIDRNVRAIESLYRDLQGDR